jgi:hypothetical protein
MISSHFRKITLKLLEQGPLILPHLAPPSKKPKTKTKKKTSETTKKYEPIHDSFLSKIPLKYPESKKE